MVIGAQLIHHLSSYTNRRLEDYNRKGYRRKLQWISSIESQIYKEREEQLYTVHTLKLQN